MRLLHVVPSYYPAVRYGGPIRSVHGLCRALARRGHDVHVYTTNVDGAGVSAVPTDRPVELDGVLVHYFPVTSPRRLYRSPAMARALRFAVAGFDAVHLHSVFLWPTWAAARAARRARVPYLLSPRGMLVADLIAARNRWVKTAWIRLIERRTLAEAAALHVTAELEAVELRALGLRLPPLRTVPNGLDIPPLPLTPSSGPEAAGIKPYALFLSRLSWKKGLDRLIEAWRLVPALDLVIAGPDEDGYRAGIEAMVRDQGLADRVRFIGQVSDDDKWPLYRDALLFVLPSYSENFGNVVIEAMAMSCPVIVTPDVGAAAAVTEAGAGLVTSNEPAALAQAVNVLLGDPARRHAMGLRGAAAVRAHFSWDAVAAEMESLYVESLTAETGAPRGPSESPPRRFAARSHAPPPRS